MSTHRNPVHPLEPRLALASLPPQAVGPVDAASKALQSGQIEIAERHLSSALAVAPDHPDVLRLLGIARRMSGRHAEAVAILRRALVQRPQDALTHNALGSALDGVHEPDAAIAAFRRACELAPEVAAIWYNLGKALAGNSYTKDAVAALQRAVTMAPENARARFLLANALRALGRSDEAAAHYRGMLAQRPESGEAWLGLANLKRRDFDAADITTMRHAIEHCSLDADDSISIRFALAQALHDHARYPEAFSVLADANRRVHAAFPWDGAGFSNHVESIRTAFADPVLGADREQGSEVTFIVSMPRAGSSLVEQILASHPQCEGAGELDDLTAVIAEESRRRNAAFPDWVGAATSADWTRLGQHYLERTARWRKQRPRFTDKMPDNWRYAGAALAMLPQARVVNCRRDAVETCFSCYRQLFANGAQAFSYGLTDVAKYWRDYDRLSNVWCKRFATRVRDQCYEALLADPAGQIRALLDFCGLDFDSACLRFFETQRSVRTASAVQVREPLRSDTAQADRYGSLLDPLRAALGMVV